jgi:hypothetical protein
VITNLRLRSSAACFAFFVLLLPSVVFQQGLGERFLLFLEIRKMPKWIYGPVDYEHMDTQMLKELEHAAFKLYKHLVSEEVETATTERWWHYLHTHEPKIKTVLAKRSARNGT